MNKAIPMTMTYDELLSELADTQLHLGELYHQIRMYKTAITWFKASAGNGNSAAYRSCANMLYDGQGVEKNLNESIKWYSESVKLGNVDAMYQIAYIWLNDFKNTDSPGCTDKGKTMMEVSAKLGCVKAINYINSNKAWMRMSQGVSGKHDNMIEVNSALKPYGKKLKKHPMTLRSQSKC